MRDHTKQYFIEFVGAATVIDLHQVVTVRSINRAGSTRAVVLMKNGVELDFLDPSRKVYEYFQSGSNSRIG